MQTDLLSAGSERRDDLSGVVYSEKYRIVDVWSPSVRLFHGALGAILLSAAITSMYDKCLDIHVTLGFLASGLIAWRVCYGFTGPFYSRFRNFVVSPIKLWAHLKEAARLNPPLYIGHNPPHGWMVIAFFMVFALISLSGLMVYYGEENQGWLREAVSFSQGERFKEIHEVLAYMFGIMVFIHVGGVAMDSILHENNLVMGMITGKKRVPEDILAGYQQELLRRKPPLVEILLLFMALIFLCANYYLTVWIPNPVITFMEAGEGQDIWQKECADCHEAFHPSLLPERSWKKLMGGLEDHFGDDAALNKKDSGMVMDFLARYSAERSPTEAAYKINSSILNEDSPIRISETPYWMEKHKPIKGDVYERKTVKSKSRCSSCHRDAASGAYEDSQIAILE